MKREDQKLNKLINNLNERNKELNCLYEIDDILKDDRQPLEAVISELIRVIPLGFRYSDICAVRIKYGDFDMQSGHYTNTALKMQIPLMIEDQRKGEITVAYIKSIKSEKGIFMPQEHKLLSTIVEKLGNFIVYKNLRTSLHQLEQNNEQNTEQPLNNNDKLMNWLQTYHLSEDEIAKLLQFKVDFKKGETLCKQGAITSYIMLLSEGLTKNYLEGNQEKGFNFKIVTPFDFIGLTSLYGNNRYLFSGTALMPSTIYMIEKPLMKDIIKNNTPFTTKLMEWYGSTTEYHLKRLSCIANKQSLGRIAEILLYLSEDVFKNTHIPNSISRKDIAELAGMSTESAVRIISELKKDGIIQTNNRGISIADIKLLKTLSIAG
ncbi:MAG: Crp/Fnr family transcriptional regulator [Bacteroidales bacterium]